MPETQLVKYDAMCRAIVEAHSLDEVKNIRNQARVLEHYARQAKNLDAERLCREIRERAEREWGKRYSAGEEKANGAREPNTNRGTTRLLEVTASTLHEMGVSKHQSRKWQARAAIPEDQFEATLAAGKSTDPLIKRERRKGREAELAEKTANVADELGLKLYNVIYADPPWRFEPRSRKTGMDRAADNHYPTMPLADIQQIDLPAADDCVLFLWATVPMLQEALQLMAAWGFAYKSHCIWAKDHIATGFWFRNAHELLLVGTRGNIPAPAPGDQENSILQAPVGKHSEKPPVFATMIDRALPELSKARNVCQDAKA
jgi:N6-adenosine-specific RNA methylase IME4